MTERVSVRLSDESREHLSSVRRLDLSPSDAVRFALEFTADILGSVWTSGVLPPGTRPTVRAVTVDAASE
ncbi:hypothetical protein N566_02050 [Streptomycetaceae bacterium MP113-05]|nr:hypothetical protein N566_02050 [Streptomycetaceae bacterium MP113-05]